MGSIRAHSQEKGYKWVKVFSTNKRTISIEHKKRVRCPLYFLRVTDNSEMLSIQLDKIIMITSL